MTTDPELLYMRWKLAEGTVVRLLTEGQFDTPEYRQANAQARRRYDEYRAEVTPIPTPFDIRGWQQDRGPSIA